MDNLAEDAVTSEAILTGTMEQDLHVTVTLLRDTKLFYIGNSPLLLSPRPQPLHMQEF